MAFGGWDDEHQAVTRIDYEPEDVTAAFKAFARNAPDGMIRVHDLREALRTYMHAEVSDSQVEELLQHYKDLRIDVDIVTLW